MTDMTNLGRFYINGSWVAPSVGAGSMPVIDPSTESAFATVALGTTADAEAAILAARAAFMGWTSTSFATRLALMQRIRALYAARQDEIAAAISLEMGAALSFAIEAQAWAGIAHIDATIEAAERFVWEERRGNTLIKTADQRIEICFTDQIRIPIFGTPGITQRNRSIQVTGKFTIAEFKCLNCRC